MSDAQQPQPAGTGTSPAEAAAELAEIRRRQEQVLRSVLVPVWFWWVIAAAIVAIGAARDSGDLVVQAITIPLAVLVMVVLTAAMIPEIRRRVQVHTTQTRAPTTAAIFGMIVLVDAAILGTAASLHAAGFRYPGTIGCAAGAAVLVIIGPLLNRYVRRLMLSQARQQMNDAPEAGDYTP
jgi:quinol-cytochrome oxidoreductase complex cytochrome b subunit